MPNALVDGFTDALGRILAETQKEWRRDLELISAETRRVIAELEAKVSTLTLSLQDTRQREFDVVARRLASLKDGERGEIGPAGDRGPPGECGPPGERGLSGETIVGPKGDRGEPGESIVGSQGEQGEQGPPGEAIVGPKGDRGESGESIVGSPGERGERGDPGETIVGPKGDMGARGERGDPGESIIGSKGDPGETGAQGSAGERGIDGRDGIDGNPGERGPEGAPGKLALTKVWIEGAVYYDGELVFLDGSTFQARRDTARQPPHDDWAPVALRGMDAPVGRVCGLFNPEAVYKIFDIVVLNDSEWRAKYDAPGPLPGDGWAKGAGKGKRGDRGDRGERGLLGPKGEDGATLIGSRIENETLVLSLSGGVTVACDLSSLRERWLAS